MDLKKEDCNAKKEADELVLTLGRKPKMHQFCPEIKPQKRRKEKPSQSPLVYPQNPRDTESCRRAAVWNNIPHDASRVQQRRTKATPGDIVIHRFSRCVLIRSAKRIYRWREQRGEVLDVLGKEGDARSLDLMTSETPSSDRMGMTSEPLRAIAFWVGHLVFNWAEKADKERSCLIMRLCPRKYLVSRMFEL